MLRQLKAFVLNDINLKKEIDQILSISDYYQKKEQARILVAPTSELQDNSIMGNWSEQFLILANEIENC